MVFISLNPWHIHFSRGAYEVTPALFFITLGIYLLVLFQKNNRFLFLVASLTSLVISMYTYNIARVFIPVFIVFLGIRFFKKVNSLPKSKLILTLIIPFIFLLPFIFSLFSDGGYQSAKGTLIPTSAVVQASNLETRSYIGEKNSLVAKVF